MRRRGFLGRDLEAACERACVQYKRENRGLIKKTAATSIWQHGEQIWISKGDVDFVGDADGLGFRAEAKETHEVSLPLEIIEKRQHQVDKLAAHAARGGTAGFILGFLPRVTGEGWSCWWVPFANIKDFLTAPWRRSITRDMCAAWGKALPIRVNPSGKLVVRFLDGAVVADKEQAIARMNEDRLAHPLELPLPEPVREKVLPAPKTKVEAELRQRFGGRDPFDPVEMRRFARRKGIKGKRWDER